MSTQFIVMGVSGCGKTSLAQSLAAEWGVPCIEGDDLHTPDSVRKMSAGIPLDDSDRWPWLDRIGTSMVDRLKHAQGVVASCSALKLAYRERLRCAVGQHLRFVMIELDHSELEQRIRNRRGHYMPGSLLESQLLALERPTNEPDVLILDGRLSQYDLLAATREWRLQLLKSGETW